MGGIKLKEIPYSVIPTCVTRRRTDFIGHPSWPGQEGAGASCARWWSQAEPAGAQQPGFFHPV